MALFNFFGNTTPVNVTSENDNLNFGLEFEVTEPNIELAGYRVYVATAAQTATQCRLYDVLTQTVIDGPVVMPTDPGWQEVMLGAPVSLNVGTRYKLQRYLPDVDINYGFTAGVFATDITSGPIHAFSHAQSTNGQGTFKPGVEDYADQSFNQTNYFVDGVFFQPDTPVGEADMPVPSNTDKARVFYELAIPATWPDDVTATEQPTGSGIVTRAPAVAAGSTAGGMVVQPQGNESVSGAGTTTVDPVAGTVVATTGAIATAGLYRVNVNIAHVAGTAVAIDDLNYAVRVNTTHKATLAVSRTNGVFTSYEDIYVRVTAAQTINVAVLGTGTAGVRDSAVIIATKVAD